MNRHERGMREAVKAAFKSKFYSHRVGAALFQGNRVIAVGCNQKKSHPQNTCSISRHGEFDALIRLPRYRIEGGRLYIARLTRTDRVSYAKPCVHCHDFLLSFPLDAIYYAGYDGQPVLLV